MKYKKDKKDKRSLGDFWVFLEFSVNAGSESPYSEASGKRMRVVRNTF